MTKKKRTVLFLICLFLFLLITPAVIFYSQGYRFDFERKKISQTGGLFLKVWPKSAEVYLDDKLKKKTDFFFGSVLIENLLPKKYKVEIKKEEYHTWQKDLEIKEREATEAKNIFLIPENPKFTILMTEVDDFYFTPDNKKIVSKEKDETGWVLKIYDLERNVKSHLISEKEISKKGGDFLGLRFSPNSREILLNLGIEEEIKNFALEIDKTPPVLTEKEDILTTLKTAITYQALNKDIYYLEDSGHLFKTDSSLGLKTKITEGAFSIKPETEYELYVSPVHIFLREDETLYKINPETKSFEKLAEPIKSLKISLDNEKIAYFNDYEIWVLFTKDKLGQPPQKAGDKSFIARFSEKIGEVFWYTNYYLIFNVGGKTKIAEIDQRDRINIVDIGEFKNPKIFWNQDNKKLYVLSEGNLFASESLIK